MKLLVLTTRLFGPPRSGGEICTARLLAGLRDAGHELVLAGRGDAGAAARWAQQVISLGDPEPPFDEQPLLRRLCTVTSALAAGEPVTVFRQGGRRLRERVAARLQACDAVVVDHLQAWPWLGGRHHKPLMLLNHNVESDEYMRRSRATVSAAGQRGGERAPSTSATRFVMRREAHGLRALELEALQKAAVVACLSEADAQRLEALAARDRLRSRAQVLVLRGYPLAPAAMAPLPRDGGRPAIGLIGTWTWTPNRQALHWLLDRVWPALADRARLVLAGSGLDGLALPPGTQVLGRVADARSLYAAVDVIAIPSLSGSGVQEKAIEAIATGRPVVATPHALRGLGEGLPPNVVAAAEPAAFAEACLVAALPICDPSVQERGAAAVSAWSTERRAAYADDLDRCLGSLRPCPAHGDAVAAQDIAATAG